LRWVVRDDIDDGSDSINHGESAIQGVVGEHHARRCWKVMLCAVTSTLTHCRSTIESCAPRPLKPVGLVVFFNPVQARIPAIIATCLAIVVSFLWMPYYPPGSIVLIALDVVAIWGVATWNTSRETA
jgi:hypothetical protein